VAQSPGHIRLSVVVPAFNEAGRIAEPLRRIDAYLGARAFPAEVRPATFDTVLLLDSLEHVEDELALRRLTYTNIFAFPPALAVRGLLPLLGVRRREGTDFRTHARSTNALLLAAYRVEAALLRRLRLPVGLSVAAVATR